MFTIRGNLQTTNMGMGDGTQSSLPQTDNIDRQQRNNLIVTRWTRRWGYTKEFPKLNVKNYVSRWYGSFIDIPNLIQIIFTKFATEIQW